MTRSRRLIHPLVLMLATLGAPTLAVAQDFTVGAVTVERPWARATPGGATVAGGYMILKNDGDVPERLVSASAEIAGHVGPHSMTMEGGVMRMRPLPDGIPIPAHGSIVLSPSGDHLMLEQLKRPLKKGERFAGTLAFAHAGALPVTFTVESIGAKAPPGAPGTGDGGMKGMKMD